MMSPPPKRPAADAPSGVALSPSRERHQRTGKAGSAVAPDGTDCYHAQRVARTLEQLI
jgi:hypothetical protein